MKKETFSTLVLYHEISNFESLQPAAVGLRVDHTVELDRGKPIMEGPGRPIDYK